LFLKFLLANFWPLTLPGLFVYACRSECRRPVRRVRPPSTFQLWTSIIASSAPTLLKAFARASSVNFETGVDLVSMAQQVSAHSTVLLGDLEKYSPEWRITTMLKDTGAMFVKWIGPDGDFQLPDGSGNAAKFKEFELCKECRVSLLRIDEFRLLSRKKQISYCLAFDGPATPDDLSEKFLSKSIDERIDYCLNWS
jgi:hypothetical protein